jgi:hypothetical protein
MARKAQGPQVDRRGFLTGVVAAGAATAMASPARAAEPAPAPRAPSARRPSMRVAAAETGTPRELARVPGIPGSLREAVKVVQAGQPALLNVWTQPR